MGRGNTTLPFGRVSLPLLISALSEEGIREYAFEQLSQQETQKSFVFIYIGQQTIAHQLPVFVNVYLEKATPLFLHYLCCFPSTVL